MTYLYETIPTREGDEVKRFEIKQSMSDLPLTKHPETGEPIRRVILGGWGLGTGQQATSKSKAGGCGCGPSGCC
jgi:predicted nucleic acid-binding Zn ribbon protein